MTDQDPDNRLGPDLAKLNRPVPPCWLNTWITGYLIDPEGIIASKDLRGEEMATEVDRLVREILNKIDMKVLGA